MMRRHLKLLTAAFCVILISGCIILLNSKAANAEPGSTTDPLVSQSYVDDKFNQILTTLSGNPSEAGAAPLSADTYNALISDVMIQIEALYGDRLPEQFFSTTYMPVSASAGQILVGAEGTEIILRSGQAVAYCPGENGLVDATDGIELFNDNTIQANHILIVPRNDMRGVRVTEEAWFIIKGDFSFIGN